jgi:hypothetical protein
VADNVTTTVSAPLASPVNNTKTPPPLLKRRKSGTDLKSLDANVAAAVSFASALPSAAATTATTATHTHSQPTLSNGQQWGFAHSPPPPPPLTSTNTTTTTTTNKRLYLTSDGKWVTRDIASLDFLWGIPLAAERDIVVTGWQLQMQRQLENQDDDDDDDTGTATSSHHSQREPHYRTGAYQALTNATTTGAALSTAKGTWWEKWVRSETIRNSGFPLGVSVSNSNSVWPQTASSGGGKTKNVATDAAVLEQPTRADSSLLLKVTTTTPTSSSQLHPANTSASNLAWSYAPGRRLEGDEAIRIHIPLTFDNTITKQRSIARQAALREWELQTAHGLVRSNHGKTNGTDLKSAAAAAATAATAVGTSTTAAASATTAPVGVGGGGARASTVVATAQPPMLDGRLFFSANSSYPISVFSVIRYEPSTLCTIGSAQCVLAHVEENSTRVLLPVQMAPYTLTFSLCVGTTIRTLALAACTRHREGRGGHSTEETGSDWRWGQSVCPAESRLERNFVRILGGTAASCTKKYRQPPSLTPPCSLIPNILLARNMQISRAPSAHWRRQQGGQKV